jgi:etoposide-induced 2.4 mRNA
MHPSPYMPIRLRVFAPVIFLNDCIVNVLSLCTRRRPGTRATKYSLDRDGGPNGRIEEGDGDDDEVELRPLPRAPTLRQRRVAN